MLEGPTEFSMCTRLRFNLAKFCNSSPNNLKIAINSIPVKMGKFTDLNGVKVQRKQLNQLSKFLLSNMGTPNILVSHCHIRTYSH